jgi:ubiquinone/menaquinone biosynthesis C-methylase UbiE
MIMQRKSGSSAVVQATAEALPFANGAFAASLAILTVHHWTDRARGLNELGRVARDRVVILTFDPSYPAFWLVDRYFPAIKMLDQQTMPSIDEIASHFEDVQIRPVLVPHDCTDGFLGAYWRRPAAYLFQ